MDLALAKTVPENTVLAELTKKYNNPPELGMWLAVAICVPVKVPTIIASKVYLFSTTASFMWLSRIAPKLKLIIIRYKARVKSL